jgi:orotate phosphoribosyltransferase
MSEAHRAALCRLLQERALLRGDFVLSSGQRSSYYLDARLVTLSAQGGGLVGEAFLDLIRPSAPHAVAGLTLGADPIVTAIAVVSGQRGEPVDGLIVRKEQTAHGTSKRIEGPWRDGLRIAIVEDTMTTGDSALQAARAVTEAGGTVCGVFGLVDRQQGAREAVESAGYPFAALFTIDDILAA